MSLAESISGEKAAMEGQVNSPERINPKKPRQKAAHSMTLSKVRGSFDHASRILDSRSGVMGRRLRFGRNGPTL